MEMKTDNETQGHGVIIAKRPGHTKDVCWDIHDKPPDWKWNKGIGDKWGRAYKRSTSLESNVT